MKNRVELYPATLLVVFMLLLSFPKTLLSQDASPTGLFAQERLAVVSKYEGDVKVEHESRQKTVKKIGNRIRNSAVYEEDSVMTMHASTADLVFGDNTSLEIDEDTSLTISTKEMSGEEKAEGGFIRQVSGGQGGIVRNINIQAGKFLANITPSKSVLTEFETPTGVASVRGTMFTLAYVAGVTSIDLTQGLVEFAGAGNDVSFSVEPGDSINVSMPELGHTSIGVMTGQLDVATNTGTLIVESGESSGVDVDAVTGDVTVTAEEGTVDFETSTGTAVIEEGEAAGTNVNADTGDVTISSEHGSVSFETETGTATIEEGVSATTSKDCTDTCQISLGAEDGTVEFETSSGKVVIEDGEAAGTRVDEKTGEVSVMSEGGMIDFETSMGKAMMSEGDTIGALVDAETGEVIMTAEVGSVEFETAMGKAMMEEGGVLGAIVDAETGDMIMTAEIGMMAFETAMGKVTMDEGDAMGAHMDAESGEMFMSAEEGALSFETSGGTASLEHGEVVGTSFDNDTGEITMTAVAGEVSFDTPMGMAVMQEGAVVEVVFDDNTGEMSMSSGGGTYTLETDSGIITMEDGGSMDFTVDHNTGEMTVSGVSGDVVMTNEDGTTTTIEAGTSLGIMHDDGHDGPMGPGGDHDGPMGPGDGHDGPMGPGPGPDDGHDGPDDDDHDGMGPDGDFEGTYTETTDGGVYEGTMTDDTGTYIGTYTDVNDSFTGTFVDAYTGGTFTGTFTDSGFTGTFTDASGNTYNFSDFQQSSFYSDENDQAEHDNAQQHGGTPTLWEANEAWSDGHNAYTDNIFGKDNNGNDIVAPGIGTTAKDTGTAPFFENFNKNGSDNFAVIHTGFGSNEGNGFIEKVFNFASPGSRSISFDYNFITTENPNETNPVNDVFLAQLIKSTGAVVELARESVQSSTFTFVSGLPGDTLDNSNGFETGWIRYNAIISDVPAGTTTLRFKVTDNSDNFADSAVLLDNVVDPPVAASSTDYMLTFAKMLRGDIDIDEADLEADAMASEEHQAFIAKVNEVINDMENISDAEFVAGKDEFFDRLWVARDTLTNHEDSAEFLQQTGVAHHLLEASIMTDEGIGSNITAIKDSINQAKTFLVAHINDFGETDSLANIRTNIDSVLANIDNVNNNEFTTATIVAIRGGIKKAFSDTIDHMSGGGHECINGNHLECEQSS